MWLRCRNSLTGHEASIPVDLVQSSPDWTPAEGAEPSDLFAAPTYNTAVPAPSDPAGTPDTPGDKPSDLENQGD